MFKLFNVIGEVSTMENFLKGDVFSAKFHDVLDNYFAHTKNLNMLIQKILPMVYASTSTSHLLPNNTTTKPEHESDPEDVEPPSILSDISKSIDIITTPLA